MTSYEERKSRLKESVFTADGMKQIIDTGHKQFDKQTVCLSTGNVWSPTLHGGCIRAWNNVKKNWGDQEDYEPGHYQEFDLKEFEPFFREAEKTASRMFIYRAGWTIKKAVREEAQDEGVILYALYSHTNSGGLIVHGFIMTRTATDELLRTWYTGVTHKSDLVVEGVAPYISWRKEDYPDDGDDS